MATTCKDSISAVRRAQIMKFLFRSSRDYLGGCAGISSRQQLILRHANMDPIWLVYFGVHRRAFAHCELDCLALANINRFSIALAAVVH